MKNKIYFRSSKSKENGIYPDFLELLGRSGNPKLTNLKEVYFKNIFILFDGSEISLKINDQLIDNSFKFIFYSYSKEEEEIVSALSNLFKDKGIEFSIPSNDICLNPSNAKLSEMITLVINNIMVPKTVYITSDMITPEVYGYIKNILGTKFVMKTTNEMGGSGICLVNNFSDIALFDKEKNRCGYLFQEYIENDGDFRVLFLGGKIKSVENRIRAKDSLEFRNNISLGAKGNYRLPDDIKDLEFREIGEKIFSVTNKLFLGIDFIWDENRKHYLVLEYNNNPGVTEGMIDKEYLFKYLGEL